MMDPYSRVNRLCIRTFLYPLLKDLFSPFFHVYRFPSSFGFCIEWGEAASGSSGGSTTIMRGVVLSCGRDLDFSKHLCEISFLTWDFSLTEYPNRQYLQNLSEIMEEVYRAYYLCRCGGWPFLPRIVPCLNEEIRRRYEERTRIVPPLCTQLVYRLSTQEVLQWTDVFLCS